MAVIAKDNRALPRLTPNFEKILESILYVIEQGEKAGGDLTQFDIAKTLFLADYRHLQNYGRPISFDNFTAMKHGPVPSLAYDMLKPSFNWVLRGLQSAPWRTQPLSGTKRHYFGATRSANRRKLSETDLNELREAFRWVRKMGFAKTSDLTHKLAAYKEAWNSRGSKQANDMDLRKLLPDFDSEMIADLQMASRYSA